MGLTIAGFVRFCLLCGCVRVGLFVFVFVSVWLRLQLEVLCGFGLLFVCLVVGGLCLFGYFVGGCLSCGFMLIVLVWLASLV